MKTHSSLAPFQSYLAARPKQAQIVAAKEGDRLRLSATEFEVAKRDFFIKGILGSASHEVFKDPVRLLQDFANTRPNPEDVLRFTRVYGVLREKHRERLYYDEDSAGYELGTQFLFSVEDWAGQQKRFWEWWKSARNATTDLPALLSRELRLDRTSRTGPLVEIKLVSKAKGYGVALCPGDLWQALCLALLACADRLRECKNEKCSSPCFVARRRDQKSCSESCARLAANRRWWTEHGQEWRARREKQISNKSCKRKGKP